MPPDLVTALDGVDYDERRRTLRVLQTSTHNLGFAETMTAAEQLTQEHQRITQGPLELLAGRVGVTHYQDPDVDLKIYDELFTS